jgi:hypothetical protein
MDDKQTLSPPYPIPTVLTVVPPVDEPQSNSQAEETIENADESDESTGQVELKTFKTKITRVNPDCNINSDRQGASRSESNRSIKYNLSSKA